MLEEQEELQSLLSSDSFSGDLSGLLREFEPLRRAYEEAIKRVEQLMAQIEAIRDKWNDWSETQRIIQMMMRTIESDLSDLRKGTDNSEVSDKIIEFHCLHITLLNILIFHFELS